MLITKENLLKSGYEVYKNNLKKINECYVESYEKRFDDKIGKKYFIHYDCYDNRHLSKHITKIDFQVEAQFNTNKETFNITYFASNSTTIEDIEQFFEKMFTKMNCKHYEETY